MVVSGRNIILLLNHKVSAKYLGNYAIIWEVWPVSPGISKPYMVIFFAVHDMGYIVIISPFIELGRY